MQIVLRCRDFVLQIICLLTTMLQCSNFSRLSNGATWVLPRRSWRFSGVLNLWRNDFPAMGELKIGGWLLVKVMVDCVYIKQNSTHRFDWLIWMVFLNVHSPKKPTGSRSNRLYGACHEQKYRKGIFAQGDRRFQTKVHRGFAWI